MAKQVLQHARYNIFLVYIIVCVTVVYARPQPTSNHVIDINIPNFSVSPSGGWNTTRIIVAGSAVGVCALFILWLMCVSVYKLCKRKHSSVVPEIHSDIKITIDGYACGLGETYMKDLKNITNNFSQDKVIARGGSATVYKGELRDGSQIAVKRTELEAFKSEIAVLSKVRHKHLVALCGYCLDGNERLLAYEYMPQGTLSRFLFNWKREHLQPLEWMQRLVIALDVARGVEYLHVLAQQSFIHRDLKPSNILLGDDMRAKVADFGLARPAPDGEYSFVPVPVGTFGYRAPEYAGAGRVTTKMDVFSFGVILMELITGRRAVDATQQGEGVHLMDWFQMHIDEGTLLEALDPALDLDEEALGGVCVVAKLAGHCCASKPHQRPDMSHVVNVLSSLAEPWSPAEPDPDNDPDDFFEIDLGLDEEALAGLSASGSFSSLDGR